MLPRVLFVDDSRAILDGLHLALHRQSNEWDMFFADSGVRALQHCAEQRFDVVVTDMRMPGLDGAALLCELQRRHPDVVRIVLTGHTELETALRTVLTAHRHLVKPCARDALISVIQRSCELRSTLKNDAVRSLLGGIGELPMMPFTHCRVTAALADPERPLADVTAIIEQDTALTAKVLQLVNSSFIGLGRSISSVTKAISYLGAPMLRRIMVLFQTFDGAVQGVTPAPGAVEALQWHSLQVASVARRLAASPLAAEDAFTAGMLHDVGKLFLATHMPTDFAAAQEQATAREQLLIDVEMTMFGANHAQLGAYLLGVWGLPHSVVNAVATHHALDDASEDLTDVPTLVRLADRLSHGTEPCGDPGVKPVGAVVNACTERGEHGMSRERREMAANSAVDITSALKVHHD